MDAEPIKDILNIPAFKKHLEKAKIRIAKGTANLMTEELGHIRDKLGRDYADINKVQEYLAQDNDKKALEFHKNDFNIRLDDCDFPTNRVDRNFALTHDFKEALPKATSMFNNFWIFIHGDYGTGKTSLAIRVMWEVMKNKPSLRPSWLSMNSWINSQMPEEVSQPLSSLRKYLVIDDFDKFNFKKEFQGQAALRLVEKLIYADYKVIFTANFSIKELIKKAQRFNNYDLELALDRVRGKIFELPKFVGQSKR